MKGDAPCDNATWNKVTWKKVIRGSGSFPVTVAIASNLAREGKIDTAPTIVVELFRCGPSIAYVSDERAGDSR